MDAQIGLQHLPARCHLLALIKVAGAGVHAGNDTLLLADIFERCDGFSCAPARRLTLDGALPLFQNITVFTPGYMASAGMAVITRSAFVARITLADNGHFLRAWTKRTIAALL